MGHGQPMEGAVDVLCLAHAQPLLSGHVVSCGHGLGQEWADLGQGRHSPTSQLPVVAHPVS